VALVEGAMTNARLNVKVEPLLLGVLRDSEVSSNLNANPIFLASSTIVGRCCSTGGRLRQYKLVARTIS